MKVNFNNESRNKDNLKGRIVVNIFNNDVCMIDDSHHLVTLGNLYNNRTDIGHRSGNSIDSALTQFEFADINKNEPFAIDYLTITEINDDDLDDLPYGTILKTSTDDLYMICQDNRNCKDNILINLYTGEIKYDPKTILKYMTMIQTVDAVLNISDTHSII